MELSIVIPVYNVEKYIKNTLNSLVNQQRNQGYEVIIVNDGSTDNTLEIVNEIILNYNLTNYKVIDKENEGVSNARNKGLNEANGKYVMFLDGDDLVSNNFIEIINDTLKYNEEKPDLVCWGYNIVKEEGKTIVNYFKKYNSNLKTISGIDALQKILIDKTLHIWTGSAIYRRDLLLVNNLKFTEGCSNGEDQEFIIKALMLSNKVVFVNEILSFYLQREDSISHIYSINRFDAILAMKRIYEYLLNTNDKRVKRLASSIKNEKIIENYFYNFNSCMTYLFENNKLNSKKALRYIQNDIEMNYPGLNAMLKPLMKSYSVKDKKKLFKAKLFFYFPSLYYEISHIKVNLKILIKRLK